MGDAGISFLLEKVDYFVRKEVQLAKEINAKVSSLKPELEYIKAFMKEANAKGEHNRLVSSWLKDVDDLAYEIQDVLDMFAFQCMPGHSNFITQWFSHHSIDDQIEDVKKKLQQSRLRYANITTSHASSSTSETYTYFHPRIAPLFMDDADDVGIEEPKEKLISWALYQGRQRLEVLFVVGMGGSGKTALAKKVYETVKENFDCDAWITLSKSIKKRELLWNIFNHIVNPKPEPAPHSFSQVNEVDLIKQLQRHLQGKRYVIVLDDLWVKDVWKSIAYAFPKDNHSRVIVTTRRGDIAFSCRDNSIDVYKLQPLPVEAAQQLFHRKAFPETGICPSSLEWRSQNILKRCEGLPLAIIEIGQLLSNTESRESEWKKLHDSLGSELKRDGRLSNIMRVLCMSYDDLPYHLKYCFLYLSIFPEDYPIKRARLIRLWIAEGFIIEATGKEVEDVGEEYLNELIERSLIQISEFGFDGKPRSCRVHHLMHQIILSKSGEDNFCSVVTQSERNFDENRRRLSIQDGGAGLSRSSCFTKARTFFAPCWSITDFPSSLKLLRVLHLEGASFQTFPMEILNLMLLKYLCLSNTNINSIPKSLGNLPLLETLDLKQTGVTMVPKAILKLENLRHLLVYRYDIPNYTPFDCVKGFEVSATFRTPDLQKLQKLQKLAFIKADRHPKMIHGLGNLTQLRKLGIIDLPKEVGANLCHSIEKLQNLRSLNITSLGNEEFLDLMAIRNPPPLLRRLYLKGRLDRFPTWTSKLHDLERIRLKWSRLAAEYNYNPIQHLQDLPNLLELQLLDAYLGNQLEFSTGKFQKLKILELEQLEELKMVIMEEGTLPHLQKLIIRKCKNLEVVPVGIDNLTRLEELHLYDMPEHFVAQIRNGGQLHSLVHHIPHIHYYYLPSNDSNWIREYLGIACQNICCRTLIS
ncbi:hypothetical protein F0562_030509 [Nyssa sinensis]|uniref:NB-ARC domain-containing protein n=1 Tax=Nyssa sinensis TaxID=561372 RepID=A0A5J5AZZ7_9ASTE|nr:hypothetical protein F0562_030509 [Nyssa sinensis]